MKLYTEKAVQVVDSVYCDMCGHNTSKDSFGSEYAVLEAKWGYGAKLDGIQYEIHICETCFIEIIGFVKNKRKFHLGPFVYPYEYDPLDGKQ